MGIKDINRFNQTVNNVQKEIVAPACHCSPVGADPPTHSFMLACISCVTDPV